MLGISSPKGESMVSRTWAEFQLSTPPHPLPSYCTYCVGLSLHCHCMCWSQGQQCPFAFPGNLPEILQANWCYMHVAAFMALHACALPNLIWVSFFNCETATVKSYHFVNTSLCWFLTLLKVLAVSAESLVLIILEGYWGSSIHPVRITLLFSRDGSREGWAGIEIWRRFLILEPLWISSLWTCYFSMQVCCVYYTFIGKLSLDNLNINNSSHCRFNQEIMNCALTYILSKCGLIVQIGNLISNFQ